MSLYEKNGSSGTPTTIKEEKNNVSDLIYSMITSEQLSSACATPDEDESSSRASTTNDDGDGTPASLPTDELFTTAVSMANFGQGKGAAGGSNQSPAKSRRSIAATAGSGPNQHSILPNGKKTKGRVKIKMEFIDNKLRRYTTFSKRKTGIMKKAFELSTLTGTQVMLLVASETGHVYTFATKKLQPMITSEAGKALIQTCLNSPDSTDGPQFGEGGAMSANFHTSEIASLTPASLLFASSVTGNNSGSSVNQPQSQPQQPQPQQRSSSNNANSARRSQKSHQMQQQCADAIQDVLAAAAQARAGVASGKLNNAVVNDLSITANTNAKAATKTPYYSANELPTMVPPNSGSRFGVNTSTAGFLSSSVEAGVAVEDEEIDPDDNGVTCLSFAKDHDQLSERDFKSKEANEILNGGSKRRAHFQKHGTSPSSSSSLSSAGNVSTTTNTLAGSTLNNILHNIVANRQQQKQQNVSSTHGQSHSLTSSGQHVQHQNRRKRHLASGASQYLPNKQANISGQTSSTPNQMSNSEPSTAQSFGSQIFPFTGLIPSSTSVGNSPAGAQANSQQPAFGLFPALSNGAFLYPPGIVYTPTPVSLPEGAAAALALQQMLATVVAASNNSTSGDIGKVAQQRAQTPSGANSVGRNSSPSIQSSQQPLIPLSLPLSMMTANYLAAQQSQREMKHDEFEETAQANLDEEESD